MFGFDRLYIQNMQAEHDIHSCTPTPIFLYYLFRLHKKPEYLQGRIGVGVKMCIKVISANFITKAKSVFAQAFTSNFAVATA